MYALSGPVVEDADHQGDDEQMQRHQVGLTHDGRDEGVGQLAGHARHEGGEQRDPPGGPEDAALDVADRVADQAEHQCRQAERRLQEEVEGEPGGEAEQGPQLGAPDNAGGDGEEQHDVGSRSCHPQPAEDGQVQHEEQEQHERDLGPREAQHGRGPLTVATAAP